MQLIHPESVGETVDAINEVLFYGRPVDPACFKGAAEWIAGRCGMPGAYLPGMVAPMDADLKQGFRLFTGELVTTGAGTRHILGEEAGRVLAALRLSVEGLDAAVLSTADAMEAVLGQTQNEGRFCCATCSVAVWRNLAAGGLHRREERLVAGAKYLRGCRSADGRWGRFPFYYTLLALSEADTPGMRDELRYAAPVVERVLGRGLRGDAAYTTRRRAVLERALAAV